MRLPPIDIIIPFHGRADLFSLLFTSIRRVQGELKELDCAIIAVNDSPGDQSVRENLVREANGLDGMLECTVLENEVNQGFVRSANRALRETIRRGHDALLLNSDTVLFPGAVSEIRRVAYLDSTIGFVSPRSNNASLCSLPHQHEYNSLPPDESFAIYDVLARRLPDHHYVPTGVGFCLYIKLPVLERVGIFDEAYSPGYNEENDLIMRARGCGYCAVLANHAYVYHLGSASFAASATDAAGLNERNLVTLTKRYPHFLERVDQYYRSEHMQAELLLIGLLTDNTGHWDLLLDLSALPTRDDHASRAIREVVIRLAGRCRPWFNVFLTGNKESLEFHRLHELSGVPIANLEKSRVFAAALHFGAPCGFEDVVRLSKAAVCNVYAFFDPVMPGTPSFEEQSLDELWDSVFQHADGVIYEGDHTRVQLRTQYKCHPAVRECVADLSEVRNSALPDTEATPESAAFVRATEIMGRFLKETVDRASFEHILIRRLRSIRLLRARAMEIAELRRHFEEAEADRAVRLEVIEKQGRQLGEIEAERNTLRSEVAEARRHFEAAQADRAARLEVIEKQGRQLGEIEAERNALLSEVAELRRHFEAAEADRAARLEVIEKQGRRLGEIEAERNALRSEMAELRRHFEAAEADRAARLEVIDRLGRQLGK